MSIPGCSREQGPFEISSKTPHNAPAEYTLPMRQLEKHHLSLFRIFRDRFFFLTRMQIERFWTLPTSTTNRVLLWLVSGGYLERRYRADTFSHFQTPLYYLGKRGWLAVGNPKHTYAEYKRAIESRAERQINHTLATYDVLLKFILEADVKQIIESHDQVWKDQVDFGNTPDAWIAFGEEASFIEVDLGTEWGKVLQQKFGNYTNFKVSGGYDRRFPGCTFRVLVITTTEPRIGFMQRLTTSDDIWFCTMREFLKEPLAHQHWFALRGFYALPIARQKEVSALQ
jgi:hypothetical protein